MTATILLIRHAAHEDLGQHLSGRGGGSLTAEGRAQAAAVADRLRRLPIAGVQSSPSQRAQETASAIASRHGLCVETVDALDEIDFGAWTGLSFRELDERPDWQHWNRARASARATNGEAMTEAQARAIAHLRATLRRFDGKIVAMVTHCDIIRALICWTLGVSLDELLRFDAPPASVTRLAVDELGARLLDGNESLAA